MIEKMREKEKKEGKKEGKMGRKATRESASKKSIASQKTLEEFLWFVKALDKSTTVC